MRVLQVHNRYRHFGGEDVIVNLENKLLKRNNIIVEQLLFNNDKLAVKNLFYNKDSYKSLKKKIEIFKPHLIHVHNLFYYASPSILKCAKDNGIPVVMTLHNYRLICPNGLLMRGQKPCLECVNKVFPVNAIKHSCFQNSKLKSLALSMSLAYHNSREVWDKYIDKIIVLTPFSKEVFINSSLKIDPKKIVIKPNSVDDFQTDNNEIKKDYLYIGRLSHEKGVQTAINAFSQLPDLKLHILGDGPLREGLEKCANKNIIFHGMKEMTFVKNKIHKCKALIFPSVCFEGLPNTILEAYSSGVPVISSNIENINNIVVNGITGLHFISNNEDSLVEKIIEFESLDVKNYGIQARRKYLKKYTHDKNILSLLKIYKGVIENYGKSNNIKITN